MRQRILMAVLIGMLGMLGSIVYMSAATNTSARPKTYREAVERVLDARRVDYQDVEVVDGCAPNYQRCETYAGAVRVLAAKAISGRIDCRERWTTCALSIPEASISHVPLEDTRDPLLARWEEVWGGFWSGYMAMKRSFVQRS